MGPQLVSVIQPDYAPKRWVVLGPFPNRTLETPGASGATREGYDRDYLTSLGGAGRSVVRGPDGTDMERRGDAGRERSTESHLRPGGAAL